MHSSLVVTSSSVKRIFRELKEISENADPFYIAKPLEDNMFEWHFTIRGPIDSEFEGGIYHGRIIFPSNYPISPPDIIFLTENGRFVINQKICLSITHFHLESWQPSFGVRTILLALSNFMTTPGDGAVGSINWSREERIHQAKLSIHYKCPKCGVDHSNVFDHIQDDAIRSNRLPSQPPQSPSQHLSINPIDHMQPSSNESIEDSLESDQIKTHSLALDQDTFELDEQNQSLSQLAPHRDMGMDMNISQDIEHTQSNKMVVTTSSEIKDDDLSSTTLMSPVLSTSSDFLSTNDQINDSMISDSILIHQEKEHLEKIILDQYPKVDIERGSTLNQALLMNELNFPISSNSILSSNTTQGNDSSENRSNRRMIFTNMDEYQQPSTPTPSHAAASMAVPIFRQQMVQSPFTRAFIFIDSMITLLILVLTALIVHKIYRFTNF